MATTEELLQKISLALSYIIHNQNEFSDSQALQVAELYPAWHIDVDYRAGQIVRYDAALYRCVQAHKSQADWTPDNVASLWNKVSFSESGVENWIEPTGVHNAYNVGDHVMHNGIEWISLVNGNTWEPSESMPTIWTVA